MLRKNTESDVEGAKPRRYVPSKFGSQYAIGQATCHFTLVRTPHSHTHTHTPFHQSAPSLPGLEWEDGERGDREQKIRASW